jgi:hypothetical protein
MWTFSSTNSEISKVGYLRTILPANAELELVSYMRSCALLNHGPTTNETHQLAFSFVTTNGINSIKLEAGKKSFNKMVAFFYETTQNPFNSKS